jgi:hypothetical protein
MGEIEFMARAIKIHLETGLPYEAAKEVAAEEIKAELIQRQKAKTGETGQMKVGAGGTASSKRRKWTDDELRSLWQKSIVPGMTTQKLADEYGISRQGIEKQIDKAEEKFSKMKSKKGCAPKLQKWPPT